MEKANRGQTSAAGGTAQRGERLRELFSERLALLKGERSLRAFAADVGIPHSTIHSWSRDERSQPNMAHLRAIAEHAEFPGVKRGRLSVDWLCGLSDEPDRDARAEVGQLPGVLANHVALEVTNRVPRTGFWKSFVSYWRTDGGAIIEQAIERELDCFRRASDGLDELARSERAAIEEQVDRSSPVSWPERGRNHEQRKASRDKEQRRRRGLVGSLVHTLKHAEFVRRVNELGAALIYDPRQRRPARRIEKGEVG